MALTDKFTIIGVHEKFFGVGGETVEIVWGRNQDKFDVIRSVAMILSHDDEVQPLVGIRIERQVDNGE